MTITKTIAILVLAILAGGSYLQYQHTNKKLISCKKNMMYCQGDIPENETVNGLYFVDDEYYCVYLKGREDKISKIDAQLSAVQETAIHEYCHHMVHSKPHHFCDWIDNEE